MDVASKFYSIQDLREVKPGSIVYPYVDTKNEWSTYLAPQWGSNDRMLEKHGMAPYITLNTKAALGKTLDKTLSGEFGKQKCYRLNRDLFEVATKDDWIDVPVIYPNPIGIFLGEIILLMDEQGTLLKDQFYSKVLTLSGDVVWV